ncbi:tricarboxylic transporter [Chromatiales bacterium (ex Bugula neritina AB1)]|nr:tricarboxylic transporter [Chromatiales bacterium (ex Bugula neritina AB1)]
MSDRIFGAISGLVALAYIASATQIQVGFLPDPVGSKLFPILIGSIALLCSITIFLKPDESPDWPGAVTFISILCAIVALVGYAYTLKPLGFLIPTAVASGIISFLIQRRFLTAIMTGMGLSIGLFFLFKYALGLGLVAFSKTLIG